MCASLLQLVAFVAFGLVPGTFKNEHTQITILIFMRKISGTTH